MTLSILSLMNLSPVLRRTSRLRRPFSSNLGNWQNPKISHSREVDRGTLCGGQTVIKIQSLGIKEFRGIKDLTLEPARKNFAVYGPNGSGKSGMVDAIEFVLTGSISRLTGSGTGTAGISVKKHAPHVDQRNAPDFARVVRKALEPSINKEFTVERRVSNPAVPIITPGNDPEIKSIVEELQRYLEPALTRREIIKYVLAAPR